MLRQWLSSNPWSTRRAFVGDEDGSTETRYILVGSYGHVFALRAQISLERRVARSVPSNVSVPFYNVFCEGSGSCYSRSARFRFPSFDYIWTTAGF